VIVYLNSTIQLPIHLSLRCRHRGDFGGAKIIGTKLANVNVFFDVERKRLVVLWNTEVCMGFIFCG
jgi:hypothetical protein